MRTEREKTWSMNQIEDEHVRIRESIALIKNTLNFLRSSDPTEFHYHKLRTCLQGFYYDLKSHFFNEESHGALIDIKDEFPEVVAAQMDFNREHHHFLDRIREMRKSVERSRDLDTESFKKIAEDFEVFCDDIVSHDQRETETFQNTFYQETGVGD